MNDYGDEFDKDPGELHNLATDPAYAKELKRMKLKLKTFQQKTNDPWVSKWNFE